MFPVVPQALVEAAQAGDRSAFESLVERSVDRAYRTARAILGSDADARDATQEAFVLAWRRLPSLRDTAVFDVWFKTLLVNSCRHALRSRRRRLVREVAESDVLDFVSRATPMGQDAEEAAAFSDAVRRAFEGLGPDERTILVLHHLEQAPLTVVAGTLRISVAAAKSRLFTARRALERALEVELR